MKVFPILSKISLNYLLRFKNLLNPLRLCGLLVDPPKNCPKNRLFLEWSQNRYRAYFKHADYGYEHKFLKFCDQIGPNGTKSGTDDQKFMLHRIVSKLVQSPVVVILFYIDYLHKVSLL